MSDSGDKTRQGGGRGPLPRTNRPRPAHAQRPSQHDGSGPHAMPEGAVPVVKDAARSDAAATVKDAPTVLDAPPRGAPPPTAPVEPRTEPSLSAAPIPSGRSTLPLVESIPDSQPEEASMLAERPTQLDTGRESTRDATRRSGPHIQLKQVGLVRAEGAPEAGPGNSYVGYIIDGRYRVEGVLGRGGMGVVYRARHEVIDKLAAIKILLPTEDPDVVERFVNEARAATAIGNAHIVDTVDFGALPDGSTYFVMEYLEGQTLARLIKKEKFLPIERAVRIARQIAIGMEAAHRAGIVHRDLKPENIFLGERDGDEDFVKLLDFGIAKIQNAQNRITRAGTIFGTPHYMSPEQAAGKEVDPRTDIYALGVILYEMLAGRVPFDAENPMGLLTQHMYTDPTPLSRLDDSAQAVPGALDAVVLQCLAKQVDDRYANMAEVVLDLERVERGEAPLAMPYFLARAERDNDRVLIAKAREALRPAASGRWTRWALGGALLVLAATVAMIVVALRDTKLGEDTGAPLPAGPNAETTLPEPEPGQKAVGLVFSPIDGEVFRDGKSIGGMPVTIHVTPGEAVEVEVRRDGFFPEKVRLDGSRPVIVVRLTAIPGVQPRVPVPSAGPLEALRRTPDAGAQTRNLQAFLAASRADAGAPRRAAEGGAPHAAPSPVPPPGPAPDPKPSAPPASTPPAAPAPPASVAPAPAGLPAPAAPQIAAPVGPGEANKNLTPPSVP